MTGVMPGSFILHSGLKNCAYHYIIIEKAHYYAAILSYLYNKFRIGQ